MSKGKFLSSVRTARNLFFHQVQRDQGSLEPQTVGRQWQRVAI